MQYDISVEKDNLKVDIKPPQPNLSFTQRLHNKSIEI